LISRAALKFFIALKIRANTIYNFSITLGYKFEEQTAMYDNRTRLVKNAKV
jgi:hypothetical protein